MISIIIATYNSAASLTNALLSVLNQTYQDWECIVVDGASKDDTITIVKDFEEKDNRFSHISEPDKGIYDAYNKGWKMAKGEWIYYLGSDDTLFDSGLKLLISHCGDSSIVYGDMCYCGFARELYKPSPDILSLGQMISHQSLIMRRDILQRFGGFDETYRICSDYDLIQKCIQSKCEMKHINGYVAKFNVSGISGSSTDNLREALIIQKKYKISHPAILTYRYIINCFKKKIKRLMRRP